MATIWFIQHGSSIPARRVTEEDFEWCVNELGLHRDLWLPRESKSSVQGKGGARISQRVFVELKEREAKALSEAGWRSGYYLVVMPVSAVKSKLEARASREHVHGAHPHARMVHTTKKR